MVAFQHLVTGKLLKPFGMADKMAFCTRVLVSMLKGKIIKLFDDILLHNNFTLLANTGLVSNPININAFSFRGKV